MEDTASDTKINYLTIKSIDEIDLDSKGDILVFDLETNGVETHSEDTRIVSFGVCWESGEAYCVQFNDWIDKETLECSDEYWAELKKIQEKIFDNPRFRIRGHNVKFDVRVMHAHGIEVKNIDFDSMIANYCLLSDRMKIGFKEGSISGHSLDDVCMHHLGFMKIRTKSLIGKKKKNEPAPTMLDADPALCSFYCCEDVDWTFRACEYLEKALEQEPHASAIFYGIEMPAYTEAIIPMECNGVKLDTGWLEKLCEDYEKRKQEALQHSCDIAGTEIPGTIPRPLLMDIVYQQLKIPEKCGVKDKIKPLKKKGEWPTDVATLELMKEHPFIDGILKAKAFHKLISTYIKPIPELISGITGLLHAEFTQTVTATGRLSSKNPNLQNIPQRTEIGRQIRKAFVSRFEGGQMVAADWSQCELRIMSFIAEEKQLKKIFLEGKDAHTAVAALLENLPEEEVTPEVRAKAKTMNFGIIYEMGVTKLAQETGMTLEEAKKFRNTYLDRMPGVKAFREKQRKQLNSLGYTETMGIEYAPGKHTLGRRRYITKVFMTEEDIPHLIGKTEPSPFQRNKKVSSVTQERKKSKSAAEREAGNHPVQGTNADICKLAMILCQRKLKKKNMQSSLCLQVHDELVFDAHPDEVEDLIEIIVETMSTIVNLEVPLVCDARAADNWADAH